MVYYKYENCILRSIGIIGGSDFDDALIGDGGDNFLRGRGGDDTMNGGTGLDWADYRDVAAVTVNLQAHIATGADGRDTLVSIENARGSNAHDTLNGSKGANVLRGKVEMTN